MYTMDSWVNLASGNLATWQQRGNLICFEYVARQISVLILMAHNIWLSILLMVSSVM